MSLEDVVVIGLAAWRLASLFVHEDGPWNVFAHLRSWAGVPDIGVQQPRPLIGGVLSCVWCAGVWMTVGAWLVFEWAAPACQLIAASAVPPIVHSLVRATQQ